MARVREQGTAAGLEARVSALARRVVDLEREVKRRPARSSSHPPEALGADLALVEQLRRRQGRRYRTKQLQGAVAYGGAVRFGERECLWIREHPLPEIVAHEPGPLAQALATLGHPARLVLLRALLQHSRTSQELQAILGVSSPGQLYHHLKELLAAGIVTQTRRSHYEVAARRVVPVLAVLAAAADLVETASAASLTEGGEQQEKE